MYLWDVEALAQDLKEERVSQREQVKYVLVWVVLASLQYLMHLVPREGPDITALASAVISMMVPILGTVACYRANGSGDDKDFLPRFFCLSFPLAISTGIGLVLVVSFLGIPLSCALRGLVSPESYEILRSEPSPTVCGLAIGAVYYWRLWKWTRMVAHSELEPDTKSQAKG
ncbi:MAG: hypothetical protein HY914_10940 [Desulfomonile tiedjei]|nr:hypothetical protein [Desulfomonile tiedjei]